MFINTVNYSIFKSLPLPAVNFRIASSCYCNKITYAMNETLKK